MCFNCLCELNYRVPRQARRRVKAGIADRRRGEASGDHIGSTFRPRAVAFARRRAWRARFTLTLGLAALLAVRVGAVYAQDAAMLDERVTQQSIRETICRPGYASAVSPPFDELMAHKDRMLAERGIDADDGAEFALDRRVPVVLGGSPDAPSNLGLLPGRTAGRAAQGARGGHAQALRLRRQVESCGSAGGDRR